jgi:hypothetical protein
MPGKVGLQEPLQRLVTWAWPSLSVLLITAIMATVALSFRDAKDRGDSGKIALTGYGGFVLSVCGIVTHIKYDAGRYVCSSGIQQQMRQIGLWYDDETMRSIGKTTDQWRTDTNFLNTALDRIFSLNAPPELGIDPIGWGQDAGYMDFMQFAFLLFGHSVQALFNGFYLLLTISVGLFCVQFRRHHFALFVGLAFAFSLLIYIRLVPLSRLDWENDSSAFWSFLHLVPSDGLDSVTNPRLLSTLTLIPLFHALFLIVYRIRPGLWPIVLFTPQAILTAAAADFRSLAYASPLALTTCCMVFLLRELWRRNQSLREILPRYWPVYVIFVCLGLAAALQTKAADSRLAAIGGMRFHTFWEPVYYDLQLHPQWKEKYAAEHDGATGDEVATVAAKQYAQRHHLPSWASELEYERDVRGAYKDFVLKDPWYVVQLKYYNALAVIHYVATVVAIAWTSLNWPLLILAGLVAGALAVQIRRKQESLRSLIAYTAALGLSAIVIAIPVWATVVEHQIFADFTLCFVAFTFTAALVMLAAGLALLSERLPGLRHVRACI